MSIGEGMSDFSEVEDKVYEEFEVEEDIADLDEPLGKSDVKEDFRNPREYEDYEDTSLEELDRPLGENIAYDAEKINIEDNTEWEHKSEPDDSIEVSYAAEAKDSPEIKEKSYSEYGDEVKDDVKSEDNIETKDETESDNKSEIKDNELRSDVIKDYPKEREAGASKNRDVEKTKKMEPPVVINFTCPEGMDREEFARQLKRQERGLNSQTVAENMDNRAAFEKRKAETGNGRDISEGKKAQDIAREKAIQSRIETNQKNGMSYSEAKAEAQEWSKTQAALHNPDQIAGGNPSKVSGMGDAGVNSSIGSQWRNRVEQLKQGVEDYSDDKTREELENTKMNVKLVVA